MEKKTSKNKDEYSIRKKCVFDSISNLIGNNYDNIKATYDSVLDSNYYNTIESYQKSKKIVELSEEDFKKIYPRISIVILTANEYEHKTLMLNIIQSCTKVYKGKPFHPFNASVIALKYVPERVSPYIFEYINKNGGKYQILHIHTKATGSFPPSASSFITRWINENPMLKPSCIVSYGVGYGYNPKKQHLGDVLIANKVYPWSIGQKIKEKADGTFGISIKTNDYVFNLRELAEKTGNEELFNNLDELKNMGEVEFRICPYLTSEAVVSSYVAKKQIAEDLHVLQWDDEYGGEMEIYGIIQQCEFYNPVTCLLIKAICDWGEFKNFTEKDKAALKRMFSKNAKKIYGESEEYVSQRTDFVNYLLVNYKHILQAYAAKKSFDVLYAILGHEYINNDSLLSKLLDEIDRSDCLGVDQVITEENLKSKLKNICEKNEIKLEPSNIIQLLIDEKEIHQKKPNIKENPYYEKGVVPTLYVRNTFN